MSVLAQAAPVCPTCRAPAVPGPDRQYVTVSPRRGGLRTLTPKARCPPPTPQPGVPLLRFVSGETRPIQCGPAQTAKPALFTPCPPCCSLGSHRQLPPWELGAMRCPSPQGWAGGPPLLVGGRDGPRGGWGHWEGPGQGWEIVPECYQPIVSPLVGLSPPAGQGRVIKGCPPPCPGHRRYSGRELGWAAWGGRSPLEPAFSSASSPSSPLQPQVTGAMWDRVGWSPWWGVLGLVPLPWGSPGTLSPPHGLPAKANPPGHLMVV